MPKHSRVCRRMTQSLRLRIWIDNLDALNGGKMVQMDVLRNGKYEDFLNFSKMTTKTKGDII